MGKVVVVFVLIAMLYVASAPRVWFMKSDSAVYIRLARSLVRGEGYTFNGSPYGKYPPVFPLMLVPVYAALGESLWAMQALVALTGVGAIAMAFALARARSGTRPALAVVVLTALCTWFWTHSSQFIMSEVPYAFLSLTALWLAERAVQSPRLPALKWLAAVVVATAAIYTRMVGAALIPALMGTALLARGQHWSLRQRSVAAGAAGCIGSLAVVIWMARAWQFGLGQSYTGMAVFARDQSLHDFVCKLQLRLSEWAVTPLSWSYKEMHWAAGLAVLCVLVLPGVVAGLRRFRSGAEFYLCAYFAVMVLAGGRGGHERYVVPVVPLLVYYGYLSTSVLSRWLSERLGKWRRAAGGTRLLWVARRLPVIAGVAVLCFALVQRHEGHRGAKRFLPRERQKATRRLETWRQASTWAERYIPEDAKVYGTWTLTHFFTGRRSRRFVKVDDERVQLIHVLASGAAFVIVEDWGNSARFLKPVVECYIECFTPICVTRRMALYRIERHKIQERLRGLNASPETGAPGNSDGEDNDEQQSAGNEQGAGPRKWWSARRCS